MKTKNFSKKLVLNKETIVHMDNDGLKKVQAGISTEPCVIQSILCIPTYTQCWSNCGAGLPCI